MINLHQVVVDKKNIVIVLISMPLGCQEKSNRQGRGDGSPAGYGDRQKG